MFFICAIPIFRCLFPKSVAANFYTFGKETEKYAVFRITYDQEVYVKNANGNLVHFLNGNGGIYQLLKNCSDGRRYAVASSRLTRLFDISCTSSTGEQFSYRMNADPDICGNLGEIPIVAQPLRDSGWYFFNLLKGGLEFDEDSFSNSLNLIIPLKTAASRTLFENSGTICNFTKRSDAAETFTDKDGIV